MSQFIEMIKDKKPNGRISDLVDTDIKSVKKSFGKEDTIEYLDISSVDAKKHTVENTTTFIVASAPSRAQQCVQKGDILVSTVRPVNRNIAVVDIEQSNLVASTGFCVLRPKDSFKEYLLSVVTSDRFTECMCDKASGGLYPAVNNGDVLSYQINIPDDSTLNKVSAIYNQADKSEFGGFKSQFIEMFGKINAEKSLCEICRPKQWPTVPTKDFTEDGYLVYGANGVIGHYNQYNHKEPTILMACRGASCGAINISQPYSYITGNAMCMDEISSEVGFEYLAFFLSNYDYSSIITGGAQPQITFSSLKKVMVPVPDVVKQEEFARIYHQADKSENVLYRSIETIDQDIKSFTN